jgi:transcriptional accessory protein Tex/SPT6
MIPIARRIADELQVRVFQVEATVALLDDKSTVPFIARYRKEATAQGKLTPQLAASLDAADTKARLEDLVKAGDIVRVRVVDVDLPRKRIALTMKLQDRGDGSRVVPPAARAAVAAPRSPRPAAPQTSLAAAFTKLKS